MMEGFVFSVAAIICIGCGLVSAIIGEPRGKGGIGFLLGFLFGPLGVLITVLLCPSVQQPTVPDQSMINKKVCSSCGSNNFMLIYQNWPCPPTTMCAVCGQKG
jgi:hypothetical protein